MLTKSTAAFAFGALALGPQPSGVDGFVGSGLLRRGHHGCAHGSCRSEVSASSRRGGGSSAIDPRKGSWSSASAAWTSTASMGHRHRLQQQQQQRQRFCTRTTMALSAGAPRSKEQEPPARRRTSTSSQLDDHRYVAEITGGVSHFLDAMDQSVSGELVTVVTYMPWCRSCHHLRSHLRTIAKAYAIAGSGAMFYEIDLDANREVHKMLDIHAAPTVLLYSSGQLVDEFTCAGASGPKVMLRRIEQQIGEVPRLRHADTSEPDPASPTPGTTTDFPESDADA